MRGLATDKKMIVYLALPLPVWLPYNANSLGETAGDNLSLNRKRSLTLVEVVAVHCRCSLLTKLRPLTLFLPCSGLAHSSRR